MIKAIRFVGEKILWVLDERKKRMDRYRRMTLP